MLAPSPRASLYFTPFPRPTAVLEAAGADAARLDGHRVDVTDEAATRELVEAAVARHGRLDALVNTVGGYAGGVKLAELDADVLDRMLALNLRSGYTLARAVLPAMLSAGRGSIVNIAAKAAQEPSPRAAAYAASGAAALALMSALPAETLGTGIRVNSVLPSVIRHGRQSQVNAESRFRAMA